jgi:hypothetical protein
MIYRAFDLHSARFTSLLFPHLVFPDLFRKFPVGNHNFLPSLAIIPPCPSLPTQATPNQERRTRAVKSDKQLRALGAGEESQTRRHPSLITRPARSQSTHAGPAPTVERLVLC